MFLCAKSTFLKADGTTQTSIWIIYVRKGDEFTDEKAAQFLHQLTHTKVAKNKAVSATTEWISFIEAKKIIKNFRKNNKK